MLYGVIPCVYVLSFRCDSDIDGMKRSADSQYDGPSKAPSTSTFCSLISSDELLKLTQELVETGDKLASCTGSTDAKQRMKYVLII